MNKNLKTVIMFAGFALMIGAAAFAYNYLRGTDEPAAPAIESGESTESSAENKIEAPDFTVVTADGSEVKLSDFLGKPVVLNFWASWCPPCKEEMPVFDAVHQELGTDVQFMMVDLVDGQRETIEKGAKYVNDKGFSFPVFYDTSGEAGSVYGIRSIPTTLFIDKDGYIITGAQGSINEAALRKGIDMIK